MDEDNLTRKAIAELMCEMSGNASAQNGAPLERKKNPIGKPNKRFLDRTITSVMKHNNRETVRTQVSSRKKLREMDDRERKRANNAFFNGGCHKNQDRSKSYKSQKSRSPSDRRHQSRSSRKRTVKKKHKRSKRKRNSGRTSRSSSSSRSCSPRLNHRKQRVNTTVTDEPQPLDEERLLASYFVQQSDATAFAAMALAYNEINEVLRCENIGDQAEAAKNEEFSDLSLSSSLSQEHLESEESEDGILTINVSSSGEDDEVGDNNKYLSSTNLHESNSSDSESNITSSSTSCISVDSNDTNTAHVSAKAINSSEDIHVLSSSNSDDEVEIVSVEKQNKKASLDLAKKSKYT